MPTSDPALTESDTTPEYASSSGPVVPRTVIAKDKRDQDSKRYDEDQEKQQVRYFILL